jgi:hypothetical protein
MSPPKKHREKSAKHTTIRLTAEDHEAIHEISKVRQANNSEMTRKNDILVDALYDLLKKETGKTREDIKALMPPALLVKIKPQSKVTQMPRKKH